MVTGVSARRATAATRSPLVRLRRHMGLVFETRRPFGRPLDRICTPDVTIREAGPAPEAPLQGSAVAVCRHLGADIYSLYRQPDGYTLRVHTLCDFLISADASSVECRPRPGTDDGMVDVLLVGTVTAVLWTLRGRPVLHGSAVIHDSRALALIGPSGSGKSTIAALCCAAGAGLLSDDLVVLEVSGETVRCVGRATELRLRAGMQPVTRLWPVKPLERATADGRTAVCLVRDPSRDAEAVPLGAVALLCPSPDADALRLTRLSGPDAVFAMLGQSRVAGLADSSFNAALLAAAAAVERQIPVVAVEVPWRPPFDVESGRRILDALGTLPRRCSR